MLCDGIPWDNCGGGVETATPSRWKLNKDKGCNETRPPFEKQDMAVVNDSDKIF